MRVFSKKQPPVEDYADQVVQKFGKDARYAGTLEGKTVDLAPQLRSFGENTLCENAFAASSPGHKFYCIPTIKVYKTERERSYNRYGFYGSVLRVEGVQHIHQIYAYTKKPFIPPEENNWIKCSSIGSLRVFALDGELSHLEQELLKTYYQWLDRGLCISQSYRFALYFENRSLSVFFWEPEVYPFDYFLDIIWDAMSGCP